MGLFGSSKKSVSKTEFKDVRQSLSSKNFSDQQIRDVVMIFRADLNEPESSQYGIDSGEIDRGIAWMKKNMSFHSVSNEKVDILEEVLKKNL